MRLSLTEVPSLRRHYPTSTVLRASPSPQGARPVPRGRPVDHPCIAPWGFPCCVRFPCVHAVATTPAQRLSALLCSPTQPCQPSPIWLSGRPAHRPFRGLLGVHSRYGLHTRAATVCRDTLSEGFSHFVSSIAAPVASGWSRCRVGLAPTGKRRLVTAHARRGHSMLGQARPAALDWKARGELDRRRMKISLGHLLPRTNS